jgi:hypothetical protein
VAGAPAVGVTNVRGNVGSSRVYQPNIRQGEGSSLSRCISGTIQMTSLNTATATGPVAGTRVGTIELKIPKVTANCSVSEVIVDELSRLAEGVCARSTPPSPRSVRPCQR